MAGIIDFPQIVEQALEQFADLLPNEPQRLHFADAAACCRTRPSSPARWAFPASSPWMA
jgi:hypothetical protein